MTSATADYRNASQIVAETLASEMTRDPSIIVLGEDVGAMGGVFGATRRLQRDFGADRVYDTPISETAFLGAAIGAAQSGLRPVVELMFVDFIGVCFDQLLNEAAKHRYMSGGTVSVPLVVKTAVGCIGSAAQHSQVLSATFAHVPGLKVVFPGSPGDLRGLLLSAIRDDDPVVFLEHKQFLIQRPDRLPFCEDLSTPAEAIPLGKLRRVRSGDDITIVSSGFTTQLAFAAAAELADTGIRAGVVDLRSIVPLDRDGLVLEAQAAPALLVVDEDYADFGVCSEVIATIAEHLGSSAPRMARHALDVPVPAARLLEEAVVPSVASIVSAATRLLR